MIRTRLCTLLGIEHPIVLGGMAAGATGPALVAAVSNAGGLGTLGISGLSAEAIREHMAAIRSATDKPYAVNFLLHLTQPEAFEAAVAERPPVLAFAWARQDQELRTFFDPVHEAGAKVMYQAVDVPDARRAAAAGADLIVAQGFEGGGHVGAMASFPLLPMVVDAVAPLPVVAAGGIADGRGLAAALALGAEGALIGTRFLATEEAPIHANFKAAILASDGHDTELTEIPDLANAQVWPGAMVRARRNRFLERWLGREAELRRNQPEAKAEQIAARKAGDADNAALSLGQDAGLITEILPAGEVVRQIAAQAEEILTATLPGLVNNG